MRRSAGYGYGKYMPTQSGEITGLPIMRRSCKYIDEELLRRMHSGHQDHGHGVPWLSVVRSISRYASMLPRVPKTKPSSQAHGARRMKNLENFTGPPPPPLSSNHRRDCVTAGPAERETWLFGS